MDKYPHQNYSLQDMKGEIWKPFPELPDHCAVSDKERVKSLERENTTADGKRYIYESKILKQWVQTFVNLTTKEEYQHSSHLNLRLIRKMQRLYYPMKIIPLT